MSRRPKFYPVKPLLFCILAAHGYAQGGQDQDGRGQDGQDKELRSEIAELRALAQTLQARIDNLEKRLTPPAPAPGPGPGPGSTPSCASKRFNMLGRSPLGRPWRDCGRARASSSSVILPASSRGQIDDLEGLTD